MHTIVYSNSQIAILVKINFAQSQVCWRQNRNVGDRFEVSPTVSSIFRIISKMKSQYQDECAINIIASQNVTTLAFRSSLSPCLSFRTSLFVSWSSFLANKALESESEVSEWKDGISRFRTLGTSIFCEGLIRPYHKMNRQSYYGNNLSIYLRRLNFVVIEFIVSKTP